nr:uncharacterized protein LOC117853836 [Setaria viridis]
MPSRLISTGGVVFESPPVSWVDQGGSSRIAGINTTPVTALASQASMFGSAQSAETEVLTCSKTRGVINGCFFHLELISFYDTLCDCHTNKIILIQSRMNSGSNNVEQVNPGFWEPKDPTIALEEEDLDCLAPEVGDIDIYEDDEARVFHERGMGVHTFKVHGQIYHKLDQLKPSAKGPRHMQLYFYDTDETMAHRAQRGDLMHRQWIRWAPSGRMDQTTSVNFKGV